MKLPGNGMVNPAKNPNGTGKANATVDFIMQMYISLPQILTLLEVGMKRDYLSSNYETSSELLSSSDPSGCTAHDAFNTETAPVLPWLPQTTAAVALRIIEFDASISYMLHHKLDSRKDRSAGNFIVSTPFQKICA